MLLKFILSVFVSLLLSLSQALAQCNDPSPSGDCDQDGIINGLDSDADNDGILDLLECQDLIEESFESSNGISVTFVFPAATTGLFIDLYALDNSFRISVNGTDLVNDELQFQSGPSTPADSDMIFAADGTRHGRNGNPNIWTIDGGPGDPVVRLKISADGQILILGKRFSNSPLEELIVQPGDPPLNSIAWNINAANTVTISQEVIGPTYINGQIFGLDCVNDSDGDGTPDYLDLNSDNDLCPDAIEGDQDFTNDDLLDDTSIDDRVDECGIPLAVGPQGQGIGTSTDPDQVSASCLRFEIVPSSPSCIGKDDGSILINVVNDVSSYLFKLVPGQLIQSTNEFNMLTAGDYSVIVSDPNSSFETTLDFTIDPSVIECLSCQSSSSPFDCAAAIAGSINVMPSGGTPQYCYSINGGLIQKDGLFQNLNKGAYEIVVSDDSGQTVTCAEVVEQIELPIIELDELLCFGDSITVGTIAYSISGTYIDTLESQFGCDSIVVLELQFLSQIDSDQEISLCKGDALEVGQNKYTLAGNYIDTLESISGCDSIVHTELIIYDLGESSQLVFVCEGDSLLVAGNVYFSPGNYVDTLRNFRGCDSIVSSELRFLDKAQIDQEVVICEGDSLLVGGNVYFSPGIYSDTLSNSNGCDSVVISELRFFDTTEFDQEISICESDSLIVGGSIYFLSGNYRDTLLDSNGCLLYTSPSPRDATLSRMPSSA